MKKIFFMLLCVSFLSYGQDQHVIALRKIADIKRLILNKPDSALILIQEINKFDGKYNDTIYATLNIYNGYYHLLKNNLDSSIYYYEKAILLSSSSSGQQARALRMLASSYRKKANYEKSLALLDKAEAQYLLIDSDKGLAIVYGEMASNYNAMLRPQDAIPYLTRAIAILDKGGNENEQWPIKQSLANTYLNIGNYQFAANLYAEVLAGFKGSSMLKNYYLTLINYSECLINLKKYEAAKKALIEAIDGLKQFNDAELTGSAYATLGRLEINRKNFMHAGIYMEKAFKLLVSVNSQRTVPVAGIYLRCLKYFANTDKALEVINIVDNSSFKNKANLQDFVQYEKAKIEIYKKNEDYGKAIASSKSVIELLDTLNKIQDKRAVLNMQAKIQQTHQNLDDKVLKKKNTQLKKIVAIHSFNIWVWFCILLGIVAIVGFYYLYNNTRYRDVMAKEMLAIATLDTKQQFTRKLNDSLKASLDKKEGELQAMEEKMSNILATVAKIVALYDNGAARNEDAYNEFINSGLKELVNGYDYRKFFMEAFSQSNAAFEENLSQKFPDLNKKDLFFCSLLRLSLPNKDLAILLSITPDAVKKKKNRLRKKIEIFPGCKLENVLKIN
jgi:tetratricopeptide (TPR) repeat protein